MHMPIETSLTAEATERLRPLLEPTQSFGLVPVSERAVSLTLYFPHGQNRTFVGEVDEIEAQLLTAGIVKRCRCGLMIARSWDLCDECVERDAGLTTIGKE
jgi:hypothetical protein